MPRRLHEGLQARRPVCSAIRYLELQHYGNSHVADEYKYLAVRDILGVVNILFEFMYTQEGAVEFRRVFPGIGVSLFGASGLTRMGCGISAIVMHGIAAFTYGDPE